MATFEQRKDKQGNVVSIRVKIRRPGCVNLSQSFSLQGDRKSDFNIAMRQAQQWASQIESDMDNDRFVDTRLASKTTLASCIKRYGEEVTPLKKGSIQELSKLKVILNHPISKMKMLDLKTATIASYRNDRLKLVSSGTVLRELALISNIFNVAISEWQIEGILNPVQTVKKPPPGKARDRRLMDGELDAILNSTGSESLSGLILLFIETAMRRSEMAALRWEDINLEGRYAYLHDTKNNESRAVPLSTKAIEALKAIGYSCGHVFTMRPDSITQAFSRAKQRARKKYEKSCMESGVTPNPDYLKTIVLHDLRHEAATRCFEKGLNIMEVAAVTGHKDLRMLKRYTHLKAGDIALKLG